jgi:hypothetical protein
MALAYGYHSSLKKPVFKDEHLLQTNFLHQNADFVDKVAGKDGRIVTEMTSRVVYLQRMATLKVDLRTCGKRSTFTELIKATKRHD